MQRFQGRFDFLFVVGVVTDRLTDNELQVGIDTNLSDVGVIEAVAFFTHDAGFGIGKAYLFFICNGFARVKLFFASPKAPTVGAQGLVWPL